MMIGILANVASNVFQGVVVASHEPLIRLVLVELRPWFREVLLVGIGNANDTA